MTDAKWERSCVAALRRAHDILDAFEWHDRIVSRADNRQMAVRCIVQSSLAPNPLCTLGAWRRVLFTDVGPGTGERYRFSVENRLLLHVTKDDIRAFDALVRCAATCSAPSIKSLCESPHQYEPERSLHAHVLATRKLHDALDEFDWSFECPIGRVSALMERIMRGDAYFAYSQWRSVYTADPCGTSDGERHTMTVEERLLLHLSQDDLKQVDDLAQRAQHTGFPWHVKIVDESPLYSWEKTNAE